MAGIGQVRANGPVADPVADPAAPAAEAEEMGNVEPNVTPEEQAQYDEFVGNAMELIYKGGEEGAQVNPPILEQLNGQWDKITPSLGEMPPDEKPLDPTNPFDNLAVTTVGIILALEASAVQAGRQLDPTVVFMAGVEILEQLADIAEAAKIHDFNVDEMTGAGNRTALLYGISTKMANKQEALAEFEHFLQTSGPGLAEQMGAMGPQEEPAPGIGGAAAQGAV